MTNSKVIEKLNVISVLLNAELYGSDAFIYGKDVYMERLNPNNRFSSYKKCFIDDYLSLPKNF